MSEIAGRLAPQVGAYHLMRNEGGRGVLLGGVPGVERQGRGARRRGGRHARRRPSRWACGAEVTVLDLSLPSLRRLDIQFHGGVTTIASNAYNIAEEVREADLVIGSVLIPGRQGTASWSPTNWSRRCGRARCWSTSRSTRAAASRTRTPTTHDDPTFTVHESVFYCVANMPGAVPRTLDLRADQRDAALPHGGGGPGLAGRAARGPGAGRRPAPRHAGALANGPVGEAHGIDAVDPATLLA